MYGVAFSPDGQTVAAAGRDGRIWLYRTSDGSYINDWPAHDTVVESIAFSPDGQTLASGGAYDNDAKLWHIPDGAPLCTFVGHTGLVNAVAFSADGQTLATGSADGTIKLWQVSGCSLLRTLTGHTDLVRSVAFSPDSYALLSGDRDATVKLWRVSDGTLLKNYDQDTSPDVYAVQFSPAGCLFAYGRYDGWVVMARNPLQVCLEQGLVAWWRMEERRGNIVPDASGWGHDLVINGTVDFQYVPRSGGTLVGGMVVFNDNGTLMTQDSDALDLPGNWTISLWVREDSRDHSPNANDTNGWLGKVRAYHDLEGGWFFTGDNTQVRMAIYGSPNFDCNALPLSLGKWYRVTATYDSATQTVRVYENKTLISECVGATVLPNAYPVVLGGYLGSDMSIVPYCKAAMADVRIYNRTLSQAEVELLAVGPVIPGDLNCDGEVTFRDINPFIDCLVNGNCECP